jgi:hypothetical protein
MTAKIQPASRGRRDSNALREEFEESIAALLTELHFFRDLLYDLGRLSEEIGEELTSARA